MQYRLLHLKCHQQILYTGYTLGSNLCLEFFQLFFTSQQCAATAEMYKPVFKNAVRQVRQVR